MKLYQGIAWSPVLHELEPLAILCVLRSHFLVIVIATNVADVFLSLSRKSHRSGHFVSVGSAQNSLESSRHDLSPVSNQQPTHSCVMHPPRLSSHTTHCTGTSTKHKILPTTPFSHLTLAYTHSTTHDPVLSVPVFCAPP